RRPGRTLLVMLLVAVPVCGMTVITVLVRTNTDTPAEAFAREFGHADLVEIGTVTRSPHFPAGTRVVHSHISQGPIGLAAGGVARLADQITDQDLSDPVVRGAVLLRSGRFPRAPGEALLSPKLARAFHVSVRDTIHLAPPKWTE